jgi:hypothetical protein
MPFESSPDVLALHAVRLKGLASAHDVAERFAIPFALADELLLDFEAYGWVTASGFGDRSGWSLTDAGRVENERRLAAELDGAGARSDVETAYAEFRSLNERLLPVITRWQIRPRGRDLLAANDHRDPRWDGAVLDELTGLGDGVRSLVDRTAAVLPRFGGYGERFDDALRRARAGEHLWVDAPGIDSCHMVWFELHEDFLATLGIARGAEG